MREADGSSTGISMTSMRNSAVRGSPGVSSKQEAISSRSRMLEVPEL